MTLYYEDDLIRLYHGDSRELFAQLAEDADVLVSDPPYGIGWKRGENCKRASWSHDGIQGDESVELRDAILDVWGDRPAVVFGSPYAPLPPRLRQVLIWRKPGDAGVVGSTTGFRRDIECIFLCGDDFPRRTPQWSSVLSSSIPNIGSPSSPAGRWRHPHAKPLDLMARLIELVPGVVIDPFAGSGSTLRAAKNLSRPAVGIEIEDGYVATAAKRLAQESFDFGGMEQHTQGASA